MGKLFHLTYSAAAEKAAREVYVQRFTVERRKWEFENECSPRVIESKYSEKAWEHGNIRVGE